MKTIVISGINCTKGGILSILTDCLDYLSTNLADRYKIIALVHDAHLFNSPNITFIEFKKSKSSWLLRLYYEYFYFRKLSIIIKPFLWLSMHDTSPNVNSARRAVYCHNPSPFFNIRFDEITLDAKLSIFCLFYKYLYGIGIKNNDYVIVQQDWIRDEFRKLYKIENIIVAHPEVNIAKPDIDVSKKAMHSIKFFYPSFPRIFKNFELICESVKILEERHVHNFEVIFTIDGSESKYSKRVVSRYKHLRHIRFIGLVSREQIFEYYKEIDCLIFPSRIETWGMPISEFKQFNKPMLLANLQYAHETVGFYDKVKFFKPESPEDLADCMEGIINGTLQYDRAVDKKVNYPFARTWEELFDFLLGEKSAL